MKNTWLCNSAEQRVCGVTSKWFNVSYCTYNYNNTKKNNSGNNLKEGREEKEGKGKKGEGPGDAKGKKEKEKVMEKEKYALGT